MRLTPSSLFLTTIVTSFVYTVNSVPVSPSDLASPVSTYDLTTMAFQNPPGFKSPLEKRHKKHHKKHHKKSHKKTKKSKKSKKSKTTKKSTKKSTKKTTTKKSSSSSSGSYEFSGDGTYYTPGLGSCGIDNSESEMVAALNAPQMNNPANPNKNPLCGKYINVHGPKGSVKVKIVDTCPPCKKGDVDLSVGAFKYVGSYEAGRIPISWSWA
ncbi:unnamed protein product [Rhizopus stolonifer]